MLSSTGPSPANGLHWGLDVALPSRIRPGQRTLYVSGWCFDQKRPIRQLELTVDGAGQVPIAWGAPRLDIHKRFNRVANARYSGFWALLQLPQPAEERRVHLGLRASINGRDLVHELGSVQIGWSAVQPWSAPPGISAKQPPLIAICMATYNPRPKDFARQIDSIRAQTHSNWVCLISDDASDGESRAAMIKILDGDTRFAFRPNRQRLGFYRNFERCLASVPETAGYVALSDQDDV